MKRTLSLTSLFVAAVIGATYFRPAAHAETRTPSQPRRSISLRDSAPEMTVISESVNRYHFDIQAPADSWVNIFFQMSLVQRVLDSDPELAAIAAPYVEYLQSFNAPSEYSTLTNLYIDPARIAAAMSEAAGAPSYGFSPVQTKWNYVHPSQIDNAGFYRWRIADYWSLIESIAPDVRTNHEWWKSQMTTDDLGQGGIPEQTFSPFLIGQATAQLQMGFELATQFIADVAPGTNTSVYAKLVHAGALKLKAQAMIISHSSQTPWNLSGVPSWTPAPGWSDVGVNLSLRSDFGIPIGAPVTADLPGGVIPAGQYVLCSTQGYTPQMTVTFNVVGATSTVTYTQPVVYVARRKIKFLIPPSAPSGALEIVSATNGYATWIPQQPAATQTTVSAQP